MSTKQYLEKNVYDATKERLEEIFKNFRKIYVSFSGGKDSSILLQMVVEFAQQYKKKIGALFVDLEGQYRATITHVEEMMLNNEFIEPYWVALPINLRNAVSVYQSQWQCWNPAKKDKWVREMPKYDCVINSEDFFPFFEYGMEFEEFVPKFGEWYAQGEKTACLVAIRSDESLNRFRTIKNERKERYKDKGYSTKVSTNVYNFYPIYDWKTEDIWTAVGQQEYKYNKIYDLMYQQGTSIHKARLCQPFGDDQRQGLELFRYIEPETWVKIVDRVAGVNYGNLYANTYLMGRMKTILPEGHSWKTYTEFLLETLPKYEAEWYKQKFEVFFTWWAKHHNYFYYKYDEQQKDYKSEMNEYHKLNKGFPKKIVDKAERKLESKRELPSWRRLAEVIIKNDKLCKRLSFAGTKSQFEKYNQMRDIYGY
jgi:predicted phosphoadenosine phosphosulfate sulfurtransferase